MDVPSTPGDPLAQPTRARVFALLADLRRPAPTEELAAQLGLHPNGVRTHLERLHAAGLVVRARERLARGRPRDTWSVSPTARPGDQPPTAYAELGRWLVRAIAEGPARVRDVEATGRQIGRELVQREEGVPAEEQMHDALVALGFQPERRPGTGDRLTYRLGNCPYRDVVPERQPLVCGLHRGLTRGMLDTLDPRTKLVGFVPKDPHEAGCEVELRGRMASEVEPTP